MPAPGTTADMSPPWRISGAVFAPAVTTPRAGRISTRERPLALVADIVDSHSTRFCNSLGGGVWSGADWKRLLLQDCKGLCPGKRWVMAIGIGLADGWRRHDREGRCSRLRNR